MAFAKDLKDTPIVLRSKIEELYKFGSDFKVDLLKDLAAMYLAMAPERISAMVHAIKAHDFDRLKIEAHSLKSSSGNLGMKRIQHLCAEIEKAASARDLETLQELVNWVKTEESLAETELTGMIREFRR